MCEIEPKSEIGYVRAVGRAVAGARRRSAPVAGGLRRSAAVGGGRRAGGRAGGMDLGGYLQCGFAFLDKFVVKLQECSVRVCPQFDQHMRRLLFVGTLKQRYGG